MIKKLLATLSLGATAAAAPAQVLMSQGFEDPAVIAATWVIINNSSPTGPSPGWQLGSADTFSAQSGSAASYMAANYQAAAPGGTLDAYLVSPTFSMATPVLIEFYARAEALSGYADQIAFGWGNSTLSSITLSVPVTVGTGGWVKYSFQVAAQGSSATGRFVVNYLGAADTSDYIGIDSVTVTAVPEPGSLAMGLAGLAVLAGLARRRAC